MLVSKSVCSYSSEIMDLIKKNKHKHNNFICFNIIMIL